MGHKRSDKKLDKYRTGNCTKYQTEICIKNKTKNRTRNGTKKSDKKSDKRSNIKKEKKIGQKIGLKIEQENRTKIELKL